MGSTLVGVPSSDASGQEPSSSSRIDYDEDMPTPPKERMFSNLVGLPQELLYLICTMSDPPDILQLSKTCKIFSAICSLRSLWLCVLDDLHFYETPNLPPHLPLTSYSTEDLKKRIINAVELARVSRLPDYGTLKVESLTRLQPPARLERSGSVFRKVDPFLLPGGQRMLVNNFGQLELWAVGSDCTEHRCLWQSESSKITDAVAFNGEVTEGGSAVMIACVFNHKDNSRPTLCIFRYDEETQTCTVVHKMLMTLYASHVIMIRGDYVLLYQLQFFELRLLNWKTGKHQLMSFKDRWGRVFRVRSALLIEDMLVVTGDTEMDFWQGDLQVFAVNASDKSTDHDERRVIQIQHTQKLKDTKQTWGLAINAFRPFWKKSSNAPIELCVVALRSMGTTLVMKSHRLQIHMPEVGKESKVMQSLKLDIKDVSSSKCTEYPMAGALSNAALIFTLNPAFKCFAAFCGSIQPITIQLVDESVASITRSDKYSVSIEPWSNTISVGSEEMVAILKFD